MDAKPHRPLRTFKVRDENDIYTAFPSKQIHSRNKSSPALSTLAKQHAGMPKPDTRRAAFADVSNTARVNNVAKDDLAVTSAKVALASLKQVNGHENKINNNIQKSGAITRPAQRPLSVSGIGRFLHSFTSNSSTTAAPKEEISNQNIEQQQPAPLKRARSKKSNVVLRDTIDEDPLLQNRSVSTTSSQDRSWSHQVQQLPEQSDDRYYATQALQEHKLPPLPPSSDSHDAPSDSSSLRWIPTSQIDTSYPPTSFDHREIYVDAASHISHPEPLRPLPRQTETSMSSYVPTHQTHVVNLDPLLELDESLAKDQFQDQWDEEGYTTARSIQSKDGYTTGATTLLLQPRITAKVEREIAAAKHLMETSMTSHEIEADEEYDTSMVAEYGSEIFEYMHELEERMSPNPYYMDHQTEVQWSMRSVLMDWLIQVHHRFQLLPETLFLCVNYIDRFLSAKVVSINKLQLVGATAILVAAKYEEIQCPTVSEIQYMVEGSYKAEEILKAERFMLSMLKFELGWPGPMSFLRRISKADDYDLETRTLAKYFLEVTIMDERFVATVPSFTAAGAHCLARLMLRKGDWTPAHVYYSNYTYSQLRPLLAAMLSCCDDPLKHHQAVFDKYGDKRYKRASFFVQSELDKGFALPAVQTVQAVPTMQQCEVKSVYEALVRSEGEWRRGDGVFV